MSLKYSIKAHDIYRDTIYPHIQKCVYSDIALINEAVFELLIPHENQRGYRLYPSSLAFMILKALSPEHNISSIELNAIASIELFHASSLLHDDVLDNHDWRRNQQTLRKKYGNNWSILAGNLLMIWAKKLMFQSPPNCVSKLLEHFSTYALEINTGQMLDEALIWENVDKNHLLEHWEKMSRYKLAAGHLAVVIGGILAKQQALLPQLLDFEIPMSMISQILNDIGDICGWRGYQTLETDNRAKLAETYIKPTHPTIWLMQQHGITLDLQNANQFRELLFKYNYEDYVKEFIHKHKTKSRQSLLILNLPESTYKDLLVDFIEAPQLPSNFTDCLSNE